MNVARSKISTQSMIAWAIDPTQKPAETKKLVKEMKAWAQQLNGEIQPVSVFSERVLNLPIDLAFPWKERFKEAAQKSLNRFLTDSNLREALTPEILFTPTSSTTKMAMELAKYAERNNALFIFANTRARKTWNPLRLGGFAETLVTVSRTPILLLNSKAKPTETVPSILFPTDFSRNSKVALANLIPLAKAFHSKISIYNQVQTPPVFPSEVNGYWPDQLQIFELMMKSDEKSNTKKATKWCDAVKAEGVDSQILVQRQKRSLGIDILDAAKKAKANLIALASQSGHMSQAILGSVARDVLLQATCPVLIFHQPKSIPKMRTTKRHKAGRAYHSQRQVSLTHGGSHA